MRGPNPKRDGVRALDSSSPNVALVHASRRYDGHAAHFRMYWEALQSQRYPVSAYTCVDPSFASEFPDWGTQILGRRLIRADRIEEGFNRFFPVYAKKLRALKEDLIHVNDVYLAVTANFRDNVIVSIADLATAYTNFHPRIPTWIHQKNLRSAVRARAVICHTRFVQNEILRYTQIPLERIHQVPLYSLLPSTTTPPVSEAPTLERPWNLAYVATDRPWKNIDFYLEVIRRLDERFHGILVTHASPRTQRKIQGLGLGSRISILSDVPDMLAVYRRSHVLLFPSSYEGFGIPLIEAMSQGLPVIASDRAAVPEVVGSGGALLPLDDPGAWSEAVRQMEDGPTYREAARASLARGREFTAGQTADRLIRVYRSAV